MWNPNRLFNATRRLRTSITVGTQKRSYRPDPKITALKTALLDRNPFYSGRCTIPDYQRLLYYTHDDTHRRVDFTKAGANELEALYRACKPAEFGRNGENVLDESYRKAGKLDLTSFSTLLDPSSLGIHEQVSKALLTKSYGGMESELYKLNVYGEGDFFKPHKDTPRGENMFGSLVVILPTPHEGGQFVLRHDEKEWKLDFADKVATSEPSVRFVAFYSDIEHEILPVTSGYRVTLTFNLYHAPSRPSESSILTPFHVKLKRALADLLNDKSILPNGGYLGFGLAHEYVHTGQNVIEPLYDQLKGSDGALADVCNEFNLPYTLRLLYREIADPRINLITTKELEVEEWEVFMEETSSSDYLRDAVDGLTIDDVEGVTFVGHPFDTTLWEEELLYDDGHVYSEWLKAFYRTPVTEVLEITPMKSSVDVKSTFMVYGNETQLDHFYGTACMLIKVDPAESRKVTVSKLDGSCCPARMRAVRVGV